jgi:serine/threonine protein kinase
MSNFFIQEGGALLGYGGFGCVFYPKFNCRTKKFNKKSKTVSKIQKKRWKSTHEIYISDLVKKIKNYDYYFVPILSACNVSLNKIKDDEIYDCPVLKDNKQFYSMELKYINGMDYIDLIKSDDIKKFDVNLLINDFIYLYNSIKILIKHSIVHFDIKSENVMYNIDTGKPMIIDFGLSISQKEIKKNLKDYFYVYDPTYYLWSPDIHLISFIVNYEKLPTKDMINIMLSEYFSNYVFLQGFSEGFLDDLKKCYQVKFTKICEGKDPKKVVDELLGYWDTWDLYALSIMFIKLWIIIERDNFEFDVKKKHWLEFMMKGLSCNVKTRRELHDENQLSLFAAVA